MCGRYLANAGSSDVRIQKLVSMMERDYQGQYKTGEIFPGDTAPAVLGEGGRLRHAPAVFGLPGFQNGRLLINARAETAAEKPTFAEALRTRRVVLPADGFYEWDRGEDKTKYLFTAQDDSPLYLCGVYKVIDGVYRFAILTRPAEGEMLGVHDRMPVIARAQEVRPYLTDYFFALRLLTGDAPALRKQKAE